MALYWTLSAIHIVNKPLIPEGDVVLLYREQEGIWDTANGGYAIYTS